jgi:hypothetical protein
VADAFTFVSIDGRRLVEASGLNVDLPATARAAFDGEELIACWGLAWSREPRRCWLFFAVENYRPNIGFIIRRETKRCFRQAVQLGETEVYTVRDAEFPSSIKLMRIFGFESFSVENGQEVWIWRSSRQ